MNDLKDGDTIAIPDDSTNESRALQLLAANGLITLKPGVLTTVKSILENPRSLKFTKMDAEELTASLESVAAAVINFNFAGNAGLSLTEDAIITEGAESPYVNIIAIRGEDIGTPAAEALKKAVTSPEVRDRIIRNLLDKGIVPAFPNATSRLARIVETAQIRLEASVSADIALARKMASSPLVVRHFLYPNIRDLASMFRSEMEGYRRIFGSRVVLWANEVDRIFYSTGSPPRTLNPDDPRDSWYGETLSGDEPYTLEIDYNPGNKRTALRIYAPVHDRDERPMGIIGGAVYLNVLINSVFENIDGATDVYFFNNMAEITGAKDVSLVEGRKNLAEVERKTGEEILSRAQDALASGETVAFDAADGGAIVAVQEIPALNWYIAAVRRVSVSDILPGGLLNVSVFMVAAFLLFVVLTGLMCAFLIFGSLERLTRSVSGLEEDSSGRVYGQERADEFGQLANTIDDMRNRISSIQYASRIQRNLLPDDAPFREAFRDHAVLWNPKDIVGGDIYWIRNYPGGTVLAVCDCTGHGTPGAMLAMLTVSALESVVKESNHTDPAAIIRKLDERFHATINADSTNPRTPGTRTRRGGNIQDGCDLAVLFVAKTGEVAFSACNTNVLVCDGTAVARHRGQRLHVGSGDLRGKEKDAIKTTRLPANPGQKIYIASDGLYDQTGGEKGLPVGLGVAEKIILEHHGESQCEISGKIWDAFETYRAGSLRCDDVLLVSLTL